MRSHAPWRWALPRPQPVSPLAVAWLLGGAAALGNAGAVANARRACEEHALAERRAEALARRLPPARPSAAAKAPRSA